MGRLISTHFLLVFDQNPCKIANNVISLPQKTRQIMAKVIILVRVSTTKQEVETQIKSLSVLNATVIIINQL